MLEYLKRFIHARMSPNDELTDRISKYTIQQVERGRFVEIIDIFKPLVDLKLIGMVKQVYEYRNWVAHGKNVDKAPSKVDPVSAYERLLDFLNKIYLGTGL